MTSKQNHADGTDNVTVTTVNSAATGDAFSAVYIGASATIIYDTAQKAHGQASIIYSGATTTGATGSVVLNGLNSGTTFARFYLRLTGFPSAICSIVTARTAAGAINGAIRINTDGRVSVQLPSFGAATTSTTTLALNTWYRIEWTQTIGTSGSELVKVFAGDATTALFTLNPTGVNTGGDVTTEYRFGKYDGAPTIADFWMDEFVVTDTNVASAGGPYVSSAPSVIASANVTASSVVLNATAVTYDNAAPTYAWSQTAGPALTLSSSTAQGPTATLSSAGTYTFSVTVTDDTGRTASSTVSFSYAGATAAPAVSGVNYAGRFVEVLTAAPALGGAITWAVVTGSGLSLVPAGNTCVVHGPTPSTATAYAISATEAGNANVTQFRFTAAGSPTATGGVRILLASDDQANGGVFA